MPLFQIGVRKQLTLWLPRLSILCKGIGEKLGWYSFKIDLEKAYDKLDWDFIRNFFHGLNFDSHSIDLIMIFIYSTTSSEIINGKHSPSFTPTWGIRQGDPLSSYIFIMCTKWLSKLIHQECVMKKGGLLLSLVGGGWLIISHLLFADDLVLFGEENHKTLATMIDTLDLFSQATCQSINLSESKLMLFPNTSTGMIHSFMTKMNCS